MRRREFISAIAGAAVWPLQARAEQPAIGVLSHGPRSAVEIPVEAQTMPTVGVVSFASSTTTQFPKPFLRRMNQLGWEEGRSYQALFRWAEGHIDRFPGLIDELVTERVNVLVALGEPALKAARAATGVIPIVGMAGDMVMTGFAASMGRPGGNATGVSLQTNELDVKRLQLLHEAVPAARRIGVLADPAALSTRPQLEEAAHDLDLGLVVVNAGNPEEVTDGLHSLESAHVDAVNVLASPFFATVRQAIIERLNRARLPAIYHFPEEARQGGLLGYGVRLDAAIEQVAGLVAKILRGARPEDLPVENAEKIDLVVNLKTAKSIGLTIPPLFLAQADEVIE
jgi:putative tryptophan/tyrosine transport system substrate-binding protein